MELSPALITIAVPELNTYLPQTGIGRVFHSLRAEWSDRVQLVNAEFRRIGLPLLRNFPYGVRARDQADLVFLPRFGGAFGLRDTQKLPSVAVVHDIGILDFLGDRQTTDRWSYLSAMQSVRGLRYATRIITVSEFTRRRLLHYMPDLEPRVSMIPNGVDPVFTNYCRSQADARARIMQVAQAQLGSPLLLYVGSELPRKNIGLLLRAFAELRRRHPNAQLLKVGTPGNLNWRKQTLLVMQSLGLRKGSDVIFLEGLSDEGLADAYRAADVFVSASLYEGFGLPALEALAIGTPVVVTDRGSFLEIVGQVGHVVEPEEDTLVETLLHVLSNQSLRSAKLDLTRISRFSWSQSAQQYFEIFNLLAKANHAVREGVV